MAIQVYECGDLLLTILEDSVTCSQDAVRTDPEPRVGMKVMPLAGIW